MIVKVLAILTAPCFTIFTAYGYTGNETKDQLADTHKTYFINEVKEWSESSSISDAALLNDMNMHGTHIPSWFKKVAAWAASGQIDHDDFVNAIKYVDDKGLTK